MPEFVYQSSMDYDKDMDMLTDVDRQTSSAVGQVPMERPGLALPKLSRFAAKSTEYATIIFFNCHTNQHFRLGI